MSSFYDTIIRNSKAYRSDAVCKDLNMLEPGTRAAVLALLADAKAQNIDLRLLETYRSQTRQSALFTRRATQLRTVGCHGYGVACDFGVFINGVYQGSNKPYVFLKTLARKHGLISGQDWGHAKEGSFVDSGHVQRVPVWRQNAMFSDSWYPPASYDPYADSVANHHADVVLDLEQKDRNGSNNRAPPLNAAGLRTDGPTLEEWRSAGYTGPYPPHGYAPRGSVASAPALPPRPAPASHVAPHVPAVPPEHHDWLAELFGL